MKSTVKLLSKTLLSMLMIVLSALIAIVLHAALPAKVDVSLLDGLLVKRYGFPVVASVYFLVLFTHCTVVLTQNRKKLKGSNRKSEIYFGLSFSLIYMIGMQEIVLNASPYTQWGTDFIYYQLLMGVGDAIPAIILCIVIGNIFFCGQCDEHMTKGKESIYTVLSFIVLIGTVRLIVSYAGAIKSNILDYPIPVTLWGYILGCVFGIVYLLIGTTTVDKIGTMLLGIGINWMIFNSFIGLVRKDSMTDALLRSTIDLVSIFIAVQLSTVIKGRRFRRNLTTAAT